MNRKFECIEIFSVWSINDNEIVDSRENVFSFCDQLYEMGNNPIYIESIGTAEIEYNDSTTKEEMDKYVYEAYHMMC